MSDVLGIDIGANSIKVISLTKEGKNIVLDVVGETKNSKIDWMKDPEKNIKQINEVAAEIKALLNDLKIKTKKAVVCLPEDQVISRLIRLPPLKDSEIVDVLKFEAETFVPYPLDKISLDYEIIEKDEAGRLTVFVIAARNDLINAYIKLFKSINMTLVALESPSVTFRRVANVAVSASNGIMVIDFGEKFSNIVALNKGQICFTRSLSVGGESLTRAISVNLGLDMASAEEYKKVYGLKENELEGKIRVALTPVLNSLMDDIRKAVALFSEDQGKQVDLLVLSGGGANLPGLAEELTKTTGIEVQIIQPFIFINTSKITLPFNLSLEGCRFSLAIGLALRGLV
ncbi:MAG: type IV pilus assembly protein PilM [Candidatus Shapirobacteria bacterium]|nr:type IV pilus assembly protein PilM [Candidatus Shapirobacteria bacterium]